MILRPIQLSLSILIFFGYAGHSFSLEKISAKHYPPIVAISTGAAAIGNSLSELNKLVTDGQLRLAEKGVRRHLKAHPNDADYLILLARIQQQAGETGAAIKTLRKARTFARDYEDIYLIEAVLLNSLNSEEACHALHSLRDDYEKFTPQQHKQDFDAATYKSRRGVNQLEVAAGYDKLTNNRGEWQAYGISNRISACSGGNFYAGYNTVNRYDRSDDEAFIGGGISAGFAGLEMEYRQSREVDILAKRAWSGVLSVHTGLSADLLLLGSRRKYDGLETRGLGIGIDYYFSNYQFLLIGEEIAYLRDNIELDSSATFRYYLGYYFDKNKYLRLGYISGKELDNDGSPNPPYSKIKTVLLNTLIPLTAQTGVFVELKRHHQSGYYEQNGIRIAIRYSYR